MAHRGSKVLAEHTRKICKLEVPQLTEFSAACAPGPLGSDLDTFLHTVQPSQQPSSPNCCSGHECHLHLLPEQSLMLATAPVAASSSLPPSPLLQMI